MKISYFIVALIAATLLTECYGQFNPQAIPKRLIIPGSVPLNNNNNQGPVIRVRRPQNLQSSSNGFNGGGGPPPPPAPLIQRNLIDESKPVTEESEDGLPVFVPQIVQQQQQPQQISEQNFDFEQSPPPQQQQQQFNNNNNNNNGPRFNSQDRPAPLIGRNVASNSNGQQPERFLPSDREFISSAAQRFGFSPDSQVNSNPAPSPQQKVRSRPVNNNRGGGGGEQQRQQYDSESEVQQYRRPQQQQHSSSEPIRPRGQQNERDKKPVAQILRKYRDENEDGTITWGFENDDGSFKEEIIGIDCVTRGRYGYIDPDGLKREYNYETGNLCDPNKRREMAELEAKNNEENNNNEYENIPGNGPYIDYQENKMILPNGERIDIKNFGKNKSRRPVAAVQQQQQQQQQFYRN